MIIMTNDKHPKQIVILLDKTELRRAEAELEVHGAVAAGKDRRETHDGLPPKGQAT